MEILVTDVSDAVTKVALAGRLDTTGVDRVEAKFLAVCTAGGSHAVVDLSAVTFIASMGIRMLISAARAMGLRKAKLVLYAPRALVSDVLNHTALGDVIPIVADERAALALVEA
jgi:anti-anti-sigma factor